VVGIGVATISDLLADVVHGIVGIWVGSIVGAFVGALVGVNVGALLPCVLGTAVTLLVCVTVASWVGEKVCFSVGASVSVLGVAVPVGALVGHCSPSLQYKQTLCHATKFVSSRQSANKPLLGEKSITPTHLNDSC
jgi:hypothetical protein